MAVLKLSKENRDYILDVETEKYWDDAIAKAEKELSAMKADHEDYDSKKEDLETLKKEATKTKEHLAKYSPTIWKLHSISKLALSRALAKDNIEIGKFKGRKQADNAITTGSLALITIRAVQICKLGLDGWSNLRDENGNEIPFDRDLIEHLDEGILYKLANEISGVVTEEDASNLN